jgi:hypothetical protein
MIKFILAPIRKWFREEARRIQLLRAEIERDRLLMLQERMLTRQSRPSR